MEKFFVRAFGVVWIGIIVFLLLHIAERPSESGMAIGFFLMSIAMVYFHFSGQFDDPEAPTMPTAQRR